MFYNKLIIVLWWINVINTSPYSSSQTFTMSANRFILYWKVKLKDVAYLSIILNLIPQTYFPVTCLQYNIWTYEQWTLAYVDERRCRGSGVISKKKAKGFLMKLVCYKPIIGSSVRVTNESSVREFFNKSIAVLTDLENLWTFLENEIPYMNKLAVKIYVCICHYYGINIVFIYLCLSCTDTFG